MRAIRYWCDVCREEIEQAPCTPHITHILDDDSANNLHYHPECCPDCQAENDATENAVWLEFLANEQLHEEAERLGL